MATGIAGIYEWLLPVSTGTFFAWRIHKQASNRPLKISHLLHHLGPLPAVAPDVKQLSIADHRLSAFRPRHDVVDLGMLDVHDGQRAHCTDTRAAPVEQLDFHLCRKCPRCPLQSLDSGRPGVLKDLMISM